VAGLAARSTLPVDVRVDRERVPPAVETAIYFTVAEALTNVAKHAQASCASVTIDIADGVITAEIADDGIGGATTTAGSGCAASPTASTPSAARSPSTARTVAAPHLRPRPATAAHPTSHSRPSPLPRCPRERSSQ
jgi:hypothetical protein